MLRMLYTQNILYDTNGLYGESRNCGWIPSWGNRFVLFFRTPRQVLGSTKYPSQWTKEGTFLMGEVVASLFSPFKSL